MKKPIVIDGRNCYELKYKKKLGLLMIESEEEKLKINTNNNLSI